MGKGVKPLLAKPHRNYILGCSLFNLFARPKTALMLHKIVPRPLWQKGCILPVADTKFNKVIGITNMLWVFFVTLPHSLVLN